jgi:hypothetical protein
MRGLVLLTACSNIFNGAPLVFFSMVSNALYKMDSAKLFFPSRMIDRMNLATSLLLYFESGIISRSATSFLLGIDHTIYIVCLLEVKLFEGRR